MHICVGTCGDICVCVYIYIYMAVSENQENLGKRSKKQEKPRKNQHKSMNNKVFLVFYWFSEIISGRTGQFHGKKPERTGR